MPQPDRVAAGFGREVQVGEQRGEAPGGPVPPSARWPPTWRRCWTAAGWSVRT
ncbi:hypothetical protein [Actinomadura litoris]|uniref:Uncharacterized protein n=1 Tax=Actinomadura litoris TaxID=2678616 RepID=A0A7K1L3Z3_9ACTN|nr:hypothetical protein [Actinomadura litoris]MUN39090.1 hypothetical protein [Actinomadura litoris]